MRHPEALFDLAEAVLMFSAELLETSISTMGESKRAYFATHTASPIGKDNSCQE
jgi:hypothetical protein